MFGRPRSLDDERVSRKTLEELQFKLSKAEKDRDDLKQRLEELRPLRCSFCGKPQTEVKKIIAGPSAYICNECVSLCAEICNEGSPAAESSD
ncbi:hypothetical protein I6N89_22555 [Pelagibaca abyssi]|nr:ClpX C4-type zinc finger protein [Salipiger abyssi]MBN9890091.1 hypothetical protein [Salipiger abyssi]